MSSQSRVVTHTDETKLAFLRQDSHLPKVIYFGDKSQAPVYLHALSKAFKGKLIFGFFDQNQREIAKQFKVTKFPSLLVYTSESAKPAVFTGELKYQPIFDFINVYSQQFIPEKVGKDREEQPWLFQEVSEMSTKSHKDICTGGEKVICFIYFSPGPIEEQTLKNLQNAKKSLQQFKSDFVYKVTWINSKKHPKWAQGLEADPAKPEVRILRTGPKPRFTKSEYELVSGENFAKMVEKILGGDARSSMLRAGLPEFAEEL